MLDVAIQMVSALDDAHAAGIVHRDIKPDNVMVRSNGLAKLLDFGIAKLADPADAGDDTATTVSSATRAGVIIGTPQFMSPEQARGLPVNQQTDIFSLGVVMHHMVSGQSPFAGGTLSDVLAAVLTREPRRLTEVPGVWPISSPECCRRTHASVIARRAICCTTSKPSDKSQTFMRPWITGLLRLEIGTRSPSYRSRT